MLHSDVKGAVAGCAFQCKQLQILSSTSPHLQSYPNVSLMGFLFSSQITRVRQLMDRADQQIKRLEANIARVCI